MLSLVVLCLINVSLKTVIIFGAYIRVSIKIHLELFEDYNQNLREIYWCLRRTPLWSPMTFFKVTVWPHFPIVLLHYLRSAVNDDVIKWKHFLRYWPFVRGIHRSSVNFLHKGQWRGALMFSLICARTNDGRANNREAGDLRRHRGHHDVTVMARLNSDDEACIMKLYQGPISRKWIDINRSMDKRLHPS